MRIRDRNERIARYQCRRHPGELTYEQRMEFNRNSVVKKALLESLRLTGKEEAGDWEAEVTVRVTDNAAGDTVMNRTLYLNDKMLRHMVPGKYIDISVVPVSYTHLDVYKRQVELVELIRHSGSGVEEHID